MLNLSYRDTCKKKVEQEVKTFDNVCMTVFASLFYQLLNPLICCLGVMGTGSKEESPQCGHKQENQYLSPLL